MNVNDGLFFDFGAACLRYCFLIMYVKVTFLCYTVVKGCDLIGLPLSKKLSTLPG